MRGVVLVAGALLAGPAPPASAQAGVVAVLSSESGPYAEALAGLREVLEPDGVVVLPVAGGAAAIPPARVVVTFGSRAADAPLPMGALAIRAMAPVHPRHAQDVNVAMVPAPAALAAALRRLQPGLDRLGLVWASDGFRAYLETFGEAARQLGITVLPVKVSGRDEIPDALRGLHGSIDALWIPPDPQIINSATFPLFAEFARSGRLPLFTPTPGLVGRGASAAAAPTFREMGRAAGRAARAALDGAPPAGTIYPDSIDVVVSRSAAERLGWDPARLRLAGEARLVP